MADAIIGKISVGDGATFTPSVNNSGVISWTNNKNLENPASVDIPQAVVDRYQLAPINSPAFTGTPTAPTQAKTDNSTKLATTAYVQAVVEDYLALTGGSITGDVDITGDLSVSGTISGNLTGNVTGDVTGTASGNLPLSGGTMTGRIWFNQSEGDISIASSQNDAGRLRLMGGSGYNKGAQLLLNGQNVASNPGHFQLSATNTTDSVSLYGFPDGRLSWNGQSIPERSYGISLVSTAGENTYTFSCNANGAVIFAKRGANCSCHMVDNWTAGSVKLFSAGTDPITITKSAGSNSVTITNTYSSAVAIKIVNGGTL